MFLRSSMFLGICIIMMQLLQLNCQSPVDPEVRSHLEAKVMSSMSLKELEEMVEKDERVLNVPKKFIIVPKPKNLEGRYGPEELDQKAYIIQRKVKKYPKKAVAERVGYGFADSGFDDGFRRASYEPRYKFESTFKYDEEFPALFGIADLESEGSSPVKSFYESLVEKVLGDNKYQFPKDPLAALEVAASEDIPSYKPRFNYEEYSKDPTETKLKGKNYWKEAPERRDEEVDENGCRTVVKKIMDPEGDKKSGEANAKSVIITKECEYPNVNAPDAKIAQIQPILGIGTSRLNSESSTNFESEAPSYESSRPVELDMEPPKARDPLAPDYIDSMLDTHFRSFPSFSNPITSFKGYQDRFKLRSPMAFKDIKPTVDVHSYEYTHPQSGFEDGRESLSRDLKDESPKTYERQYNYDYPVETPRKAESEYKNSKEASPKVLEHHYHYDYPEKSPRKAVPSDYDEEKSPRSDSKNLDKKDPKMMKKSFAYYRKDNPKEDPNDQHYAEEFAQGNYRSFSSDYDSERDGPKKA